MPAKSNTDPSDSELLASVCQQDAPAFATLVARYSNLVCSIAFAHLGDRAHSEDIAQDIFLGLWRSPTTIRNPEKLRSWLRATTRNRACDLVRRRKFETCSDELASEPDQALSAIDALSNRERSHLLWEALKKLPQSHREPLVLFYREGDSMQKVATALNITLDAAKQRIARGRKQLQSGLQPYMADHLRKTAPTAALVAIIISSAAAEAGVANASASATAKRTLLTTGAALAAGLVCLLSMLVVLISWESGGASEPKLRIATTTVVVPQPVASRDQARKAPTRGKSEHGALRLEGLVVDEFDDPVAGAMVKAVGATTLDTHTGADGSFVFASIDPEQSAGEPLATYQVYAFTQDSTSSTQAVQLSLETEPLILELESGMAMRLWVRNGAGTAIAGAKATVGETELLTDEKGFALFTRLPSRSSALKVSASGYASESLLLQQSHGKGVVDTHVVLGTGHALAGVVVNQNDSPVANVTVRGHRNIHRVSEQTTSDSNGRFHFDALIPGRYSVTAQSVHDSGAALPPTVAKLLHGPIDDLRMVVHTSESSAKVTAPITGVVVDEQGRPVAGAQLRVLGLDGANIADISKADGSFTLVGTPQGHWSILATWPGESEAYYYLRKPMFKIEASPGDSLRITLETPGALHAQVRFRDGSAPRSVWVSVSTFAAGAASFAPAIGARGGKVRLNKMPPGTYVLKVFGPNFTSLIRKDIVVRGGQVEELGTIQVARGRRLTGLVVDSSGAAQVDTRVFSLRQNMVSSSPSIKNMIEMLYKEFGAESVHKFGGKVTRTDESGEFAIAGLGDEELAIWASGDKAKGDIVQVAAGSTELHLRLAVVKGASVVGRLLRNGVPKSGTVELCKEGDTHLCAYQSFAANDGSYEFSAVAQGNYFLRSKVMSESDTGLVVHGELVVTDDSNYELDASQSVQ